MHVLSIQAGRTEAEEHISINKEEEEEDFLGGIFTKTLDLHFTIN